VKVCTRNAEPENVWQVSAIAEQGLVRLDLGFKGDVSAVTTSVDFHGAYPLHIVSPGEIYL
jgi:hypothetical protein